MKKTFFLSLACLLASGAFSQSTVIFDGENSNNRNPWWGLDATVEVVNWLQKDGTNAANPNWGATIWRSNENPAYAGGGINLDLDITAYNTISVDISKRVSGNVQVELQNGETKAWLNVYYDANGSGGYGTGTWQTLTFSIPEGWTHLTALLIAPHNENTGENPINFTDDDERHRMSWDNVKAYYDNTTAITNVFDKSNIIKSEIFSLNGVLLKNMDLKNLIQGVYLVRKTDNKGNVLTVKTVNVK